MEVKQKKVKNIRPKLKLFRASEPEKSVLMWGVSYSIANLSHIQGKPVLLNDDFKASMKVSVDNNLYVKDQMPTQYKFKEYSPIVFQDLRRRFGVTNSMFLESFTSHQPRRRNRKIKKRKSSFMLTWDKRFAAVRVTPDELDTIQGALVDYHAYVVSYNAETYIPKWLALYRIIINDKVFHTLIIANVFYPPGMAPVKLAINLSYDYEQEKKSESRKFTSFLKEQDFVALNHKITIGIERKKQLLSVLYRDMEFLENKHFNHNRLIIGILGLKYQKPSQNMDKDSSTEEEVSEDTSDGEEIEMPWANSRRGSQISPEASFLTYIRANSFTYFISIHCCYKKRHLSNKKKLSPTLSTDDSQQEFPVSNQLSSSAKSKCSRLNDFFHKFVE